MKSMRKVMALLLAVLMICNTFVVAIGLDADPVADASITDVMMTVGANETMRNLTWFADVDGTGEVRYAKAADMIGDQFPVEYSVAVAIAKSTEIEGVYSYKATMRGLEENTSYVYCIVVDGTVSKNYTFDVKTFSNDFSFTFVTDVQVVDEGFGADWIDTMNKFQTLNEFKDSSIIVSGGDQVNDSDEALYDLFINESLSSIAFAPTWGRLHDQGNLYDSHYNLPNLSSSYGNEMNTSDYYYKYNNVLFMHINTETADYKSGYEGHKAFLENAVATNPDCTWKIVVLHFSFFTGGRHSADSRVIGFRDALAGTFNDLGVDLVLSGHDHVYTRSNLMLDGTTISEDVVTNNTVTDPEGTLYICGTKASYRNFYDVEPAPTNPEIARFEDSDRKSAVSFDVTDESLTLRAYFLDGDEPEEFDNFTIYKTNYSPAQMPDCYSVTYVDELGHDFGDSTDTSLFAKRYFTTATPDEPRLSVPSGSLDEGKRMNWHWEYYRVNGDGTKVTEFVNGNDYVAYLRCDVVKISRNITIASETDVSECVYTWEDAWELLYQYPGEAFTFTLSEDIAVTTQITVKSAVNLTIDLNGKTLTATAVSSPMLILPKDADGTSLKVISSKPGGKLNAGSKAFSRLETGKGSTVSMQFGSVDTYPINVTTQTLVMGKSSFYNATYNLSIYGGTYNFSRSIFDIRNDGTNYNTYNVNLNDANINITSSSYTYIYRYDDKCASADSYLNANNCVFTGGNTSAPKDFFGSEVWKGTASFTGCVFNNIVFDSSLHTNIKSISVGENCVFKNYGKTFTEVTENTEGPEEPETAPVNDPIEYDFKLYACDAFAANCSGSLSKLSKVKKDLDNAYAANTFNWKLETVAEGLDTASHTRINKVEDEGLRISNAQGLWIAYRIRVDQADYYQLSVTGYHSSASNDYTADFWVVPASSSTMSVADVEASMVDENKLGTVSVTTSSPIGVTDARDYAAGEYVLILKVIDDRMSYSMLTLTPVEKPEEPSDTPVVLPGNTLERIPESDNILGFTSSKMALAEDCYIVTLSSGVVATVGVNSIETKISANETVAAGGTLTYTIESTNNLPNAVSVVITAKLPENTVLASVDNGGSAAGSTLSWSVQLQAGEKKTVSFQVTAGDAESFESFAVLTLDNVRYTTEVVATVLTDKIEAKIGEKTYGSLLDAVASAVSGDTIFLLDNVVVEDLILSSGITLDLNGHVLTVDSVLTYSGSAMIDSSEKDTGVLKINDADGNMISADNSQLPVFDMEADGYRFFAIRVESCAVTGGNKYWFKVDAENFDEFYKLIQSGSEVLIKVKMTWDGQEEDVFAAADLAFTQSWASHYSTNSNTYITVSVTENEGVENFTLTPLVAANGVEIPCEEM